jgi:hypothetical protein
MTCMIAQRTGAMHPRDRHGGAATPHLSALRTAGGLQTAASGTQIAPASADPFPQTHHRREGPSFRRYSLELTKITVKGAPASGLRVACGSAARHSGP